MDWAAIFTVEPASGTLRWRETRPGRGCIAGREVGNVSKRGYLTVFVHGHRHYVHRIVWEMAQGPIPSDRCIDHIDGNRLNNGIANLRLVTLSTNQRNRRLASNTQLGIHGVRPKKSGFEVNCAGEYVGFFSDLFEACCARKAAESRQGFHVNHGRTN